MPVPSARSSQARARPVPRGRVTTSGSSRAVTRRGSPAFERHSARQQAVVALGHVRRRQAQRVLGELRRFVPRAACISGSRRRRHQGCHVRDRCRRCERRCRARRPWSPTVTPSSRCSCSRWRGRECRIAAAPSSGCAGRKRSPSTATTACVERFVERNRRRDRLELGNAQIGAQGDREQNSARLGQELGDTRSEQLLERLGKGISSPISGRSRPARVRPSSSAKRGLPWADSKSRRSSRRGRLRPSRSARSRRVAPTLSGRTSSR